MNNNNPMMNNNSQMMNSKMMNNNMINNNMMNNIIPNVQNPNIVNNGKGMVNYNQNIPFQQDYYNRIYNNINSINNNNNINNNINQPKKEEKEESIFDKVKNSVKTGYMDIKNYIFPEKKEAKNSEEDALLNAPIQSLSPQQREQRSKLEEKKAYEKKILGIANDKDNRNIGDIESESTGEKVTEFLRNNAGNILTVIDIIGCLTLHGPSIGRTAMRVSNFISSSIHSSSNNSRGY